MNRELKLFSGGANPALARAICSYLDLPLGAATVSSFSDGEIMNTESIKRRFCPDSRSISSRFPIALFVTISWCGSAVVRVPLSME